MVLLAGSLQRNVSVELQTIPGTAMMAGEGYVWRSVYVCVHTVASKMGAT